MKKVYIHLNYFNQSGFNPLYLALSLYKKEKHLFNNSKNNNNNGKIAQNKSSHKYLYEYLLLNGSNLNDSIKRDELLSPLWFALSQITDLQV